MTKTRPVSLEEWIVREQYAAGCKAALGDLWKQNFSWLNFHALRYSRGDHDLADEAMGELGAKLSRPKIMRMYRPEESWKHWTRSILRNIIRDLMRRKYRPGFLLTKTKLKQLVADGLKNSTAKKLTGLAGISYWEDSAFRRDVAALLTPSELRDFWPIILERARAGQGFDHALNENADVSGRSAVPPLEKAAWKEFDESLQCVLRELPPDLRAIFLMHITLGWSFIRIADVLHGKRDANLVSRPYYRARTMVQSGLSKLGHGSTRAVYSKIQTIA